MRRISHRKVLCALATCTAVLVTTLPAHAQLEEVIVTARKRQEKVINVPVVETVLSQKELDRGQIVQLTDLPKIVPGLNFGDNLLSIGTQVTLRGVGTSSYDPGVDQSVSLNIDGLSLGNGLAFSSGMFDLQQIEVLKGPQTLFYGKSSPGGVIALHTADPTNQTEVIARAGYEFEARQPRAELILSGPVTDTLKLRLSNMYTDSDGYFRNKAVPQPGTGAVKPHHSRGPGTRAYQIRGTALWNPSDYFDARLKANLVHNKTVNAAPDQLTDCPDGTGAIFPIPGFPNFIGGGEDCKLDRNYRTVDMNPAAFPGIMNNGVPFVETNQKYGTLRLNYYPVRDITLTSLTGYYDLYSTSATNATQTTYAAPIIGVNNHYSRHKVTEELRVNSDFSGPLNFTGGLYYEDGRFVDRVTVFFNQNYAALGLPAGTVVDGVTPVSIKSYAAYFQGRWKIVPALELAAGVRWTNEKRKEQPYRLPESFVLGGFPVTLPEGPTPVLNNDVHSDHFAPEITLTYKPADNLTFFGSYKKAYKSGSFSVATPPDPGTDNSFQDEEGEGYELGMKSLLLNNQLRFNIAGYYYEYKGLQVGAVEPLKPGDTTVSIHTVNAGKARTYGVDMDVTYAPEMLQGLTLRGALSWDNASYVTLNNIPCWGGQSFEAGCNQAYSSVINAYTAQDLSHNQMVRAPKWQFNFGFDYQFLVAGNYTLVVSNNNAYSSKYPTFPAVGRPNHDNMQKSFIKTDLSFTLQSPDNSWEVALIGKNLNDKVTAGNCSTSDFAAGAILRQENTGLPASVGPGAAGIDETACFADRGRQIWLRVTLRPLNWF